MDDRRSFGRAGEDRAADHYRRLGFTILDRNYRCDLGEIDLVVGRDDLIVFCEVKARRSDRWGAPSEAVGWRKQQRLRKLAGRWLAERRPRVPRIRFDVVSVLERGPDVELTHTPAAF